MEDYTTRFAIGGGLDVNGFRESLSMQMKETVNRGFEVYFAERAGISGFCRPVEMEGVWMKLKGEMVIELTDTNTGAVETVQETNMITEAVNNILGLNPMGIYLKASGEYDNSVLWNGTLLPICPNMIGGILLFPAVLEEKADHIYKQGKNLLTAVLRNGGCFFHGRRILA